MKNFKSEIVRMAVSLRVLIPALDLGDLDLPGAAGGGVRGVKVESERRRVRALVAHVNVDCGTEMELNKV